MFTDTWISTWVLENISSIEIVSRISKFLSEINSWGQMWLILAIVLTIVYYFRNKKKLSLYLIISIIPVVAMWALSEFGLKNLFDRPRPYIEIEGFQALMDSLNYSYPSGASFPSNHALVSFAAAFIVSNYDKKLAPYAYVLASLVGLSRIILGAHYFSDVIAGMGFGILSGTIACKFGDLISPKIDRLINNKINKKVVMGGK